MRAIDIGTDCVVQARASMTVVEAAAIMRKQQAGCLVLTREDGGRTLPVGIVTDRDLVTRVLAGHCDTATTTLDRVMSAPLLCCRPDDTLDEVVAIMHGRGVRRLPVVDEDGALLGIVSTDDVLVALATLADQVNQTLLVEPTLDRAYL